MLSTEQSRQHGILSELRPSHALGAMPVISPGASARLNTFTPAVCGPEKRIPAPTEKAERVMM